MADREKAGSIISFYQQGWKELVKAARAFGRQQGLPDQARGLVERVLEYDRRLGKERATVIAFLKDAEGTWAAQGSPGGRSQAARPAGLGLPRHRPARLPVPPRHPEEAADRGTGDPQERRHLCSPSRPNTGCSPSRPNTGRQAKLAAALERMERHRLLDRFVSVMDRIEQTKPNVSEQGISPVGDEGYDQAHRPSGASGEGSGPGGSGPAPAAGRTRRACRPVSRME